MPVKRVDFGLFQHIAGEQFILRQRLRRAVDDLHLLRSLLQSPDSGRVRPMPGERGYGQILICRSHNAIQHAVSGLGNGWIGVFHDSDDWGRHPGVSGLAAFMALQLFATYHRTKSRHRDLTIALQRSESGASAVSSTRQIPSRFNPRFQSAVKSPMQRTAYVEKLVNLLDPDANQIVNMSVDEAVARVGSGDAQQVREIGGQFALLHRDGITIRMARSIGRPMRYFLAKLVAGPCLIVAERIDEILKYLRAEGLDDQFHPSYTRMVPAHYVVELSLLGCPDPNPTNTRFFAPQRNRLTPDVESIGQAYIGALAQEIHLWLDNIDAAEPIGVLFSGGIDSGCVFLVLYHALLERGESPSRLKAFTLSVDGHGQDIAQARDFLERLNLGLFLEPIEVRHEALDYHEAISVIEDYKPLDVQSATMAIAICRAIRNRYPDWKYLADGDGGDENLKDYPIEENPELTIRSVLNNLMLYHEGWGVEAVKHSLTYSGGQSRGHVRTYAPARKFGFSGYSPLALPNVIEVAEGIPFIELTDWDHDRLYRLKGDVVQHGVKAVTGYDMPLFEKRRFQRGTVTESAFAELFPSDEHAYRAVFSAIHG